MDGAEMRSLDDMLEAFSRVFEFPDYFGRNWAALDECLADLSWLGSPAYVVLMQDADQVLADDEDQFPTLIELLGRVAAEWAEPVTLGEAWDRPAVPFHTVLVGEAHRIRTASSAVHLGELIT